MTRGSNKFIPVNEPLLNGNEKKYVIEALDTGWISSEGPFVKEFEKKFSLLVNRKHGIAVSSGSAALDVSLKALNLNMGDEVIVPTFTIISCAAAIVRTGAKPVLVDSNPETWNMNVGQIEDKITERTKAIMPVHIYGLPVDMDPVLELADKYNLKIIEDAAEMLGQLYKSIRCGSFGDISVFSFYPNKHITTGEGGIIVTDNVSIADRCRSIRNLCFQKERRFVHNALGWNYRFTNIQAAIGLAQLEKLNEHIKRKREIGSIYNKLLSDINGIDLPLVETNYAENIYWVFGIVLGENYRRDARDIINMLSENNIGTRPFFWPMHEQPVFRKMGLFTNERYPIAENLARRGFYIPSGLALTDNQIRIVSDKLHEILN